MKLWLDDVRLAPEGYEWARSVNQAKYCIEMAELRHDPIEILDLDHDLGDFVSEGGDGIKLLDWLIERLTFYPIKLHTANPVGRDNMLRTINRYWT